MEKVGGRQVACYKGCPYSCVNKCIYLFSLKQVHRLRKYATAHNLMTKFKFQYWLMRHCTSMQEVRALGLTCPFSTGEDEYLCRVHNYEKPEGCAVWVSPDVELCKDPTQFPEHIAVELNSRMNKEFDCVWELRSAMVNMPDNKVLTYGPFIDERREKLLKGKENAY